MTETIEALPVSGSVCVNWGGVDGAEVDEEEKDDWDRLAVVDILRRRKRPVEAILDLDLPSGCSPRWQDRVYFEHVGNVRSLKSVSQATMVL